jgi:hypothetical protein
MNKKHVNIDISIRAWTAQAGIKPRIPSLARTGLIKTAVSYRFALAATHFQIARGKI